MSPQPSPKLADLIRRLCEAEIVGDQMICHDGGFRYSGDFMSLEEPALNRAELLTDDEYRELLDAGYIEELEPSAGRAGGFRVTERGRHVAFGTSS